jgi:protein gp37
MGSETGISWTDGTFNPWWGCTKVSPGCDNCYAESFDKRVGGAHWGKGKPRREFGDKHWNEPIKWNKRAQELDTRMRVFSGSMCDVMDDEAPEGARERLWKLIDDTPFIMWQLLTKRPHRYVRNFPVRGFKYGNVMPMATVESQDFYAPRIKALNEARLMLDACADMYGGRGGPVKIGVSYEPALGPLSIREYPGLRPHWLIFGGETGPSPRPMERKWAEDIKAECEEFGIPFFMKQFSARTPTQAAALIPVELLLRQFP